MSSEPKKNETVLETDPTKLRKVHIVLEDIDELRDAIVSQLDRSFANFRKGTPGSLEFEASTPQEIVCFPTLYNFLEEATFDPNAVYTWSNDWHYTTEQDMKDPYNSARAIIITLAGILGSYDVMLRQDQTVLPDTDTIGFLFPEYQEVQRVLADDKLTKLKQYLRNTAGMSINTAYPSDAIFDMSTIATFSAVGNTTAPVLLYQEKNPASFEMQMYNMAFAAIIARRGFQNGLPIVGEAHQYSPEDLARRIELDPEIANQFGIARGLSGNVLEQFVEEFPIGRYFKHEKKQT
ncbi:hypothetical protein HN587_05875 [Candidatus Woesearchaeota archaeon]|jgi:hypothetical protein|nr:hypothetical protein [Candidatus Woesearchaeota archaeon]